MSELKANFKIEKREPIQATFRISLTPEKVSQLENDLDFVRREEVNLPDVDFDEFATKDELEEKADDDVVVHINGTEVINGAKTFNSAVNFIGSGDSNSVGISENTRFNIHNTNKTILGMGNGLFYINHGDYRLRLRGKDTRPHYNTDNNSLALLSDIPDISNLASKTEVMQMIASIPQFALKVVTELPSVGEKMTLYLVPKVGSDNDVYNEYVWIDELQKFEHLGSTAVDLTDYALKSEIVKDFQAPIVYGGLSTSTTNISYDNNGKAYLNYVAYYATISECLPTQPIANYEIRSSFYDNNYTNGNCEFRFYKLKGYTEKYPILNLDGYNAILHNFSVGDIVMADSIEPFSGDYNNVQMCFGQIENDGTFVPKLMCMTYGWSDGVRFAKITRLYEPDEAYKQSQELRYSSPFYMKYHNDVARMSLSYKNQSGISDIANIRGIKFIEKDGAVTVAWVRENGEIVELSDTLTFDKIDFNCVIFNGYVYDNSNVTDTGIYGFDSSKYFVAKDTIDNVIVRMTDGTGFKSVGLNYNEDDFEVVENKLSLKTKIQPITQADYDALETKEANTLYLIEEENA